jgi:hypothetical protein
MLAKEKAESRRHNAEGSGILAGFSNRFTLF